MGAELVLLVVALQLCCALPHNTLASNHVKAPHRDLEQDKNPEPEPEPIQPYDPAKHDTTEVIDDESLLDGVNSENTHAVPIEFNQPAHNFWSMFDPPEEGEVRLETEAQFNASFVKYGQYDRQFPETPCFELVKQSLDDFVVPTDSQQDSYNSLVLNSYLGQERPLYLSGRGYGGAQSLKSLEELFELIGRDHRPLLSEVSLTTGTDHVVTWVIDSVNGKMRIYSAVVAPSPSPSPTAEPDPAAQRNEEMKHPFGWGRLIYGTNETVAYRNNVRQFVSGLCNHSPKTFYYHSALVLWGTLSGFGHSANCNFEYNVYEYSPAECVARGAVPALPWANSPDFVESGNVFE